MNQPGSENEPMPTEISHHVLVQQLQAASRRLLGQHPVAEQIEEACRRYLRRCEDIVQGRGVSDLIVAIVGTKGQGKSWIARQLIRDRKVAQQLPSGDLAEESTHLLHWVGPNPPQPLDNRWERFHPCPVEQLVPLGAAYTLLDTPGVTDAELGAAEIARQSLGLAPIKLLVIRRGQLRAAKVLELASQVDGAVCLPIITAVTRQDQAPPSTAISQPTAAANRTATEQPRLPGEQLRHDLDQLLYGLQRSARNLKLLEPLLVEDFEETGKPESAGRWVSEQVTRRLEQLDLAELAMTKSKRLRSATAQLRRQIHRSIRQQLPQLGESAEKMRREVSDLPRQVVASLLGGRELLENAIRGRLRAKLVQTTPPVLFPYRSVLSLLCLTQGAWDRLVLTLAGSVPSLFGTLVAWANNARQNRQLNLELQAGIKQRINQQLEDRLLPIRRQFQQAINHLIDLDSSERQSLVAGRLPERRGDPPPVRLRGIDRLQSESQRLFQETIDRTATARWPIQLSSLIGNAIFWSLMLAPLLWIYRHYLGASWDALRGEAPTGMQFVPLVASQLLGCLILSLLPTLVWGMLMLSLFLRRRRIESTANRILEAHQQLISHMESEGSLGLELDDPLLSAAEFLCRLEPDSAFSSPLVKA
jgi:hypothetical protein